MKILAVTALWSVVVCLSACQSTPEPDMTIPSQLTTQANKYSVHRPIVTINDDAYHQAIGPYQITAMDLSGKSVQSQSVGTGWQQSTTGGVLFQVLFHDKVNTAGDIVDRYQTRGEQRFQFDVTNPQGEKVHANCQLMVLGHTEANRDNGVNSYNWQVSEQDVSYLGCELTQQGLVSQLTVERKMGQKPSYRLTQGHTELQLAPVFAIPQMAKYQDVIQDSAQGFVLSDATQQPIAGVQLSLDQSRLWLAHSQSNTQQQWLVAALFSLQLYHWLDRGWAVGGASQ